MNIVTLDTCCRTRDTLAPLPQQEHDELQRIQKGISSIIHGRFLAFIFLSHDDIMFYNNYQFVLSDWESFRPKGGGGSKGILGCPSHYTPESIAVFIGDTAMVQMLPKGQPTPLVFAVIQASLWLFTIDTRTDQLVYRLWKWDAKFPGGNSIRDTHILSSIDQNFLRMTGVKLSGHTCTKGSKLVKGTELEESTKRYIILIPFVDFGLPFKKSVFPGNFLFGKRNQY